MKSLEEHNDQMRNHYGLVGKSWQTSKDVHCSQCGPEVPVHEQLDIVHTSHPPRIRVRCPECKLESWKII